MKLENIYQFFQAPPPTHLSPELAVCYVMSVLLQGESCGTELIQGLQKEYPQYRLSDTVLYNALKFLEDEKAIIDRYEKILGRGRPRRMYRVSSSWLFEAAKLAGLWSEYVNCNQSARAIRALWQLKSLGVTAGGLKQG